MGSNNNEGTLFAFLFNSEAQLSFTDWSKDNFTHFIGGFGAVPSAFMERVRPWTMVHRQSFVEMHPVHS